jgi:ubiquinone/menaquinone biosynthesis C-methylase UbiE
MTSPPRYDGLADWYDREIGRLEVTTTALEVLGRLVGAGPGTCLDLGCGTGIAIPSLLERGWRVVGVDLSGDQLRIARQRAGPPGAVLVAADATALPFADCSFDAVASVLTHTDFDDPEAAFAEAARVLRTGGQLSYVGPIPALSPRSCSGAPLGRICCILAIGSGAGTMAGLGSARGSAHGSASTICPWPT